MSDWNEELPRFKEARRLPAEQHRPVSGGKRQKREWLVIDPQPLRIGLRRETAEIRRYGGVVKYRGVDRAACEAFIDKQRRTWGTPLDHQSPERAAEYVARHKARFDRWRIVGPQGEEQ